jgi:hypothetical protein
VSFARRLQINADGTDVDSEGPARRLPVITAVLAWADVGSSQIRANDKKLSPSVPRAFHGSQMGRRYALTLTSTFIPMNASDMPTKLPATGVACRMSRATATGIRLSPPTLRFVGSKVIQPAPGM